VMMVTPVLMTIAMTLKDVLTLLLYVIHLITARSAVVTVAVDAFTLLEFVMITILVPLIPVLLNKLNVSLLLLYAMTTMPAQQKNVMKVPDTVHTLLLYAMTTMLVQTTVVIVKLDVNTLQ